MYPHNQARGSDQIPDSSLLPSEVPLSESYRSVSGESEQKPGYKQLNADRIIKCQYSELYLFGSKLETCGSK